jgi:hypothetical protein
VVVIAETAHANALAGQLGDARARYQEALEAYRLVVQRDAAPRAAGATTAHVPGLALTPAQEIAQLPRPSLPDIDFAYVTWSFLNLATYALAVAMGILLGLVVIYWPDSTWGGPLDYAVAFLWGLGVHAVGSSTFGGVGGLVKDFRAT